MAFASPIAATTMARPSISYPAATSTRAAPTYKTAPATLAAAAPTYSTAVAASAYPTAPVTRSTPAYSQARVVMPAKMEPDVITSFEEFGRQVTEHTHGIRTQADSDVKPARALQKLKDGNKRYVDGNPQSNAFSSAKRAALANSGQLPFATILGCADSRCPVETLFDAQPGDLFVLRNAGNTCTHAEGSIIGSMEYSISALRTNLVIVLGHTKCGAIAGACAGAKKKKTLQDKAEKAKNSLECLLEGLGPVALQAAANMPDTASEADIVAEAIKVNVFHSMEKMLVFSESLRAKVRNGEVELQGAIYDIVTGEVKFLGRSPREVLVLDMEEKKLTIGED